LNSPRHSIAPSGTFEVKDSGSPDPWKNVNPWPGPSTDHLIASAVVTDIKNRNAGLGSPPVGNRMIQTEAGSNIDARAVIDSRVGKLFVNDQYSSQPNRLNVSTNN
jgi:hypothetical protein